MSLLPENNGRCCCRFSQEEKDVHNEPDQSLRQNLESPVPCFCPVAKQSSSCHTLFFLVLAIWLGLTVLALCGAGCSTPVFSTDNPVLLRFPGAERKSDHIEGVLRPWERAKLIEEKGNKGQYATSDEKRVLVQQLIEEYEITQTTNIRRCCVDALAKIGTTTKSSELEKLFTKAIINENLGVQLSGITAWGIYCTELKENGIQPARKLAAEKLCNRFRELPYSIEAGAHKTNTERKDMRLAILRNLSLFTAADSPEILKTFDDALRGEKLDDGALQVASMKALDKVTGKKYGLDSQQWSDYLDYALYDKGTAPKELTAFERIPKPDLPMFK